MTHDEWSRMYDPQDVLDALGGVREDRLWEYVCQCLDAMGEVQTAELIRLRQAGQASDRAVQERREFLQAAANRTSGGGYSMGKRPVHLPMAAQRARAALAALRYDAGSAAKGVTQVTVHLLQRLQCAWLRCLFPNPFGSIVIDPSWRTSTAVAVAQGIYDDKAFDRLPILADALQDAGCENADLLSHLRSDGPHVRGCWALDLVLGKE